MEQYSTGAEGLDARIVRFIARHHVMTIATFADGMPYCANLFYAYIPEYNQFVFTSDSKTRHYKEMVANPVVGASIVLETRNVGKIQGLQLQGYATLAEGEMLKIAKKAYLKRFPYALAAELTLWIFHPRFMKLTDNRLGFGKKLIWRQEANEIIL